ncbi:hypothetical protein NNC19_07430 [Clostridium sp. SHJSY1]|uniref:hypothetical protein n=1 Tax=Clostridium sp. SHJSY1 TaxID=2942483 RepID=UPI0028746005|nr:hypothetical protein [Clostridium sp. SHJSY1]MDS0525506.1 hypothetical protein [Clostridium sp. SHJSY1]
MLLYKIYFNQEILKLLVIAQLGPEVRSIFVTVTKSGCLESDRRECYYNAEE